MLIITLRVGLFSTLRFMLIYVMILALHAMDRPAINAPLVRLALLQLFQHALAMQDYMHIEVVA